MIVSPRVLGVGIRVLGFGIWAAYGCAARHVALPTDTGVPLPDVAGFHAQLSQACTRARTLTAELTLAGRVGRERLRGRVIAGFERPGSMRLEGPSPLGPPAFILAARDGRATLLLPRGGARVVQGERADVVLEAITGVALLPADLHAILTGCVVADPRPTNGRLHANGWASIDLVGGGMLYAARAAGGWRLRAATRDAWRVEYEVWQGQFPERVRLTSASGPRVVDLRAALTEIEVNRDLDAAAFEVRIPVGAQPLTIDELRDIGPLRWEQP